MRTLASPSASFLKCRTLQPSQGRTPKLSKILKKTLDKRYGFDLYLSSEKFTFFWGLLVFLFISPSPLTGKIGVEGRFVKGFFGGGGPKCLIFKGFRGVGLRIA